jgi:hypothetical protein
MITDIHGWHDIDTAPKDGTIIDIWIVGTNKHNNKFISRRFTDTASLRSESTTESRTGAHFQRSQLAYD